MPVNALELFLPRDVASPIFFGAAFCAVLGGGGDVVAGSLCLYTVPRSKSGCAVAADGPPPLSVAGRLHRSVATRTFDREYQRALGRANA
jgi:hypothetical protein